MKIKNQNSLSPKKQLELRRIFADAIAKRDLKLVSSILDSRAGLDLANLPASDEPEEQYWKPLVRAADNGDILMAQVLLKAGANLQDRDVLQAAMDKNRIKFLEFLETRGFNFAVEGEVDLQIQQDLARAIDAHNINQVKMLLWSGANPNISQSSEPYWKPLIKASCHGDVKIAEALLKAGANLQEWPVLKVAVAENQIDFLRFLKTKGFDFGIKDKNEWVDWTALMEVANNKEGSVEIASFLLEQGLDVWAEDSYQDTALIVAKRSNNEAVYEVLAARDVGIRAFFDNVEQGNNEAVEKFIEKESCQRVLVSACELAARKDHIEALKMALESLKNNLQKQSTDLAANPNLLLKALERAANNGKNEIVNLLLEEGVDPTRCEKEPFTPMYSAAFRGHLEIVKTLMDAFEKRLVDPNVTLQIIEKSLRAAQLGKHPEILDFLQSSKISGLRKAREKREEQWKLPKKEEPPVMGSADLEDETILIISQHANLEEAQQYGCDTREVYSNVIEIQNAQDVSDLKTQLKELSPSKVLFSAHGNVGEFGPKITITQDGPTTTIAEAIGVVNSENPSVKEFHFSACHIGSQFSEVEKEDPKSLYREELLSALKPGQTLFLHGDERVGFTSIHTSTRRSLIDNKSGPIANAILADNSALMVAKMRSDGTLAIFRHDTFGKDQSLNPGKSVQKNIQSFLQDELLRAESFELENGFKNDPEIGEKLKKVDLAEYAQTWFEDEIGRNDYSDFISLAESLNNPYGSELDIDRGGAILTRAIMNHAPEEVIEYLLKAHYKNPERLAGEPDAAAYHESPLEHAVKSNNLLALGLMRDMKIDPSQADENGIGALSKAVKQSNIPAIKILSQMGVNFDLEDTNPCGHVWTPLSSALESGEYDVAQAIIDGGANVDAFDREGFTALMKAAHKNDVKTTEFLIKNGASQSLARTTGSTALIIAAQNGSAEVVEMSLKQKANPDQADSNGWTALMIAANKGDNKSAESLFKYGANPNLANSEGWSALTLAASGGHAEVVEMSLKQKANPDQANSDGWTALMFASSQGDSKSTESLFKHGANPNLTNSNGQTALILAVERGRTGVVETLLKYKANPDQTDSDGWTLLMTAADKGDAKTAKLLLENGANPNLATPDGWTALMFAEDLNHDAAAKLIEKGIQNFSQKNAPPFQEKIAASNQNNVVAQNDPADFYRGTNEVLQVILGAGQVLGVVKADSKPVVVEMTRPTNPPSTRDEYQYLPTSSAAQCFDNPPPIPSVWKSYSSGAESDAGINTYSSKDLTEEPPIPPQDVKPKDVTQVSEKGAKKTGGKSTEI